MIDDSVAVAGDYSKKIEEIVRTTLKLRNEDEEVKIIIFSHWDTILNVIAQAMAENRIEYRTKSANFHKSIDEFKASFVKFKILVRFRRNISHYSEKN